MSVVPTRGTSGGVLHEGYCRCVFSPSRHGPDIQYHNFHQNKNFGLGSAKNRCMSLLFGRRGALTSRAALDPRARLLGPPACAGLHHAKSRPVLISEQTKRRQRRKPSYWVLPAMKYSLGGLQSSRGGATPLRTPEGPAVPPQHKGWLRSVVSAVAVFFLLVAVTAPTVTAAMANPSVVSIHLYCCLWKWAWCASSFTNLTCFPAMNTFSHTDIKTFFG